MPLRGLSEEAIEALRPVDVDVGPISRSTTYYGKPNGYRQKTQMIRFSYAAKAPKRKIRRIEDDDMRARAHDAYQYLRQTAESSYKKFLEMRKDFMRRTPDANARQRRRHAQFLEEEGIECAVWPNKYWTTAMCESHVRLTDVRRLKRKSLDNDISESDAEDGEDAVKAEGRHSIKRSFLAKVFSPLLGYDSEYALLQYVYDLNLGSSHEPSA